MVVLEKAIYALDFKLARDTLYQLANKFKYNLDKLDEVLLPMLNKSALHRITKTVDMRKKIRLKVTDVLILNEELKTGHVPSFRLKPNKRIELIANNPVLSLNWAFYKGLLKKLKYGKDIKKYQLRERMFDQSYLKELSTYMLVHGPKVHKHFYIFVGIEQLYGFNIASLLTDQQDKIKNWVNNKFQPKIEDDSIEYESRFRLKVRDLFMWKEGNLEIETMLDGFVNNIPLTSTSGSAFDPHGPREEVLIGDEVYQPYNSKFAKSAVLSPEQKKKRILSYSDQKARVSVKVEVTPKSRIIVSSDYNTFLKMKFVDTWVARWMKGNPQSTLWSTDQQKLEMWRDFGKMGLWNVPIDQSAFDHHVTKRMIQIINEELILLIENKAFGVGKEDLIEVMQTIIFSMDNCSISYPIPDTDNIAVYSYESGVLSGWYWTAFYDTVANIAEKEIALEQISIKGFKPNLISFNAQGDDQLTKFKNLTMSMLYWLELSTSGFEIHPMKNFFSRSHNEYLRKYSTELGVNAYPARLVNKIMWLYPGKQAKYTPIEKLNNIYSRWAKIKERFVVSWKHIKEYLYADYRGAKISVNDYETYLAAHNYNGGKSFPELKSNNKIIETLPGSFRYHIEIGGAGYQQFKKTFGYGQEREMDRWMTQALAIPDVIKHKEIRTPDTMGFSESEVIKPIPFVIYKSTNKPKTPRMVKGWHMQDVFSTNEKVMHRAFNDIDTFVEHTSAPKSWLYDYYTGRLEIPLPTSDLINAEGSALLFEEYRNSLYSAMVRKTSRKERWKGLLSYMQDELINVFRENLENPRMFNL